MNITLVKIRTQDLNFNITYKDNNELGKLCKSFENMRVDLKEALEKQWKLEIERTNFKLNNKECDLIAYINEKNMEHNILVQDKKIKFTASVR